MKQYFFRVAACLSLALCWSAVSAQSLNDQYETYLDGKCTKMNFERDENQDLLPGQAGSHLFNYCTGPYALASGLSIANASLGAVGAESNSGSSEEDVVRRRRDKARNAAQPDAGEDFNLFDVGGTSLFLSADYLQQKQVPTDFQSGRDGRSSIVSLGVDHRFGTQSLLGVVVRYAAQSGDFDAGGQFQSHAVGAVLYGSWFPIEHLFIDINAGLDARHLASQRLVARQTTITTSGGPSSISVGPDGQVIITTPPPIVTVSFSILPTLAIGDTNSRESTANMLIGYDVTFGRFSIGPRVGAKYRNTTTNAFVESGATPMTLAFDEQAQMSLLGAVGAQASIVANAAGWVIVTQINVDRLHEYRDDQKLLTAHFAEDYRPNPTRLGFLSQEPDRDSFAARLSAVAVLPHGTSLFLSVTSTFGNELLRERGISLGGRREF